MTTIGEAKKGGRLLALFLVVLATSTQAVICKLVR
jgi:hypothetical protein